MKKFLLAMLFAAPFVANAQFTETFDRDANLPAGWTVLNGGDANGFIISEGAPNSSFSLNNAAQINYSADAHDDYLVTPAITVVAGVNDRITYFVKNQDPLYVESYDVKLSTTTPTAAALTVSLKASALAPNNWTGVVLDLSAYVGQTVYVGFHASSTDQFRLLFDNIVSDTAPTVVPGCVTPLTPANMATAVDYVLAPLSWSAPTSGGPVMSYDIYLDTNPNPTTLFASAGGPAYNANLTPNTTYYMKVVAKNTAGVATGCTVTSFTTKTNPIAPYCGPLVYSTGVEAITNVTFGGINNTSSASSTNPHELFIDSVANVNLGATVPISFQGFTGGAFTTKFIVFVDWNQDGDFLDAGESYFTTSATTVQITNSTGTDGITATGNITVPANAVLGNTRMRIKKNFSSTIFYPNPCFSGGSLAAGTNTGYGQAEDYTVNVQATAAVSDVNKNKLSVFPNPVRDVLNIANTDSKVTETSVYSMDGKLVRTFSGNQSSVKMGGLAPGAYLVKVKTSTSEQSFKVIKE